ncbi:MAG TPA: GDP-mannose 4,6-dehydratase [Anaerolineae bacterium]|nr:GDP-mannose 4,6-dehydratase [Anaerolineae bacterium]HNU03024.1 GDP-mannose 4,6-dehydratase [Anaerolineae bacterium]
MRALITGISGFVGSHLAEYLLAHTDWQISGTVYGRLDNIAHLRQRLALFPAELSHLDVVRFIVEEAQPDYLFHLAAQPIPSLSYHDPWFTLENNIRSQLNMLEAVAQLGLACRVLVVGSSEEYGAVSPADLPIDEETPLRPTSPYAVSKVTQDLLGLQYWLSRRVEAVRVRPFNHIGPRQRRGFVAPDFASQIAEIEAGLRPPVMAVGELNVARDFSDVRDIVAGYHLALTQGQAGEVYNLGAGQARSVQELLDTMIAFSSVPIEVTRDPDRVRTVETPRIVADCTRLRQQTGWTPGIPFHQSVADVLDYWRDQVASGAVDPTPAELHVRR